MVDCENAPAFWEICSQAGLRTHVLNWPTYPAEPVTGTFTSELFARFGDREDSVYRRLPRSVCPASAAAELESLRIHPGEIGHEELLPFVPMAARVNQDTDPSLAILANRLAEAATAHAVATHVLQDDWQVAAVCYDLIDRLSHTFMRFHPPRHQSIDGASFELYGGVINRTYEFCDQMLGRLLELAGPDTTVILVSEHGFRTAEDRPAKASRGRGDARWHRQMGMIAIRGESIHRDRWIWGGRVIDVCPTLMKMVGLPSDQFDGRPLADAFQERSTGGLGSEIQDNPPVTHNSLSPLDEVEVAGLKQHLIDDGYLSEDDFLNPDLLTEITNTCDHNLARSHLQFGQRESAEQLLEKCRQRSPGNKRYVLDLVSCQLARGELVQARQNIEQAVELGISSWIENQLLGQLHTQAGEHEQALEKFLMAEQSQPRQPELHCRIGETYLQLNRYDEAARAFGKAMQLNADSSQAYFGMGKIAVEQGDFEVATEYLLQSAALREINPGTHYYLARALFGSGKHTDALRAVDRAMRQFPGIEGARNFGSKSSNQVDGCLVPADSISPLVRRPIQLINRNVHAKNGSTPYSVSLAECEWRSTARNTVTQNAALNKQTTMPAADVGR